MRRIGVQSNVAVESHYPLQVKIITPEKTIFEDKVDHVVMPTSDGEIGIYANHAPLITRVKEGTIRIHLLNSQLLNLCFDFGLARVKDNFLIILIHGHAKLTENN